MSTPAREPFRTSSQMLRDAFAVWNEGDLDTLIAYIHPEIRWETSGIFPGLDPVYEGREGVQRFFRDFMEPWEEISIEPLDIFEPDLNRVIAHTRFEGTDKQGNDFEIELWQLFVLRDSALIYFRAFTDREGALAAAERVSA